MRSDACGAVVGSGSTGLPRTIDGFRDRHAGETIIVCGCGRSLRDLPESTSTVTIGVNDVGRRFDPTYLVVLNPRGQFRGDRYRFVESSRAQALFSQLPISASQTRLVHFALGKRGGTDPFNPQQMPYTRNSPYVAACLAAFMGAKRIGLIGVDFTDDHFFGQTGRHSLSRELPRIDKEYARLEAEFRRHGIELVNLSEESRLTSLHKVPVAKYAASTEDAGVQAATGLSIVSYSVTPVAGVPAVLSRCIDAATPHAGACVWASNSYGNGVRFQGDVQWRSNAAKALELIDRADLVIVHNGKIDKRHRRQIESKPAIVMAHNYGWNVDFGLVRKGCPGVVVGQYQATLDEFRDWHVVPNPVPIWEPDYSPGEKSKKLSVCYTPSSKHERYPEGHRLYWHGKGYDTTMRVLGVLEKRYGLCLEVIREKQISHRQSLAMKRRAHIVIDECVTGSYHRNSLEGLATGCVVINAVGDLPGVEKAFEKCAGPGGSSPFVHASLESLERVLCGLIESGKETLLRSGAENRRWMEQHWSFDEQWANQWDAAVQLAISSKVRNRDPAGRAGKEKVPSRKSVDPPKKGPARKNNSTHAKHWLGKNGIPAYWTGGQSKRGNFGDLLSPTIVGALSGRAVTCTPTGPRLFAVGSLLKFARQGDYVWGSGFIDKRDTCQRGIRIFAVRGPRTRKTLRALGIECPEVYGDPGILLPRIFPIGDARQRGIGIIPHYVDLAAVRSRFRDDSVRIIDIRAGVESVISSAARCEILISSSLHGCVLGDAFGIPTAWVRISDKVVGNGFKFHDYYEGTAREAVCVDWRKGIHLDRAVEAASKTEPLQFDSESLIQSFPFLDESIGGAQDILSGEVSSLPTRNVGQRESVGSRATAVSTVRNDSRVSQGAYSQRRRSMSADMAARESEPRLAVFGSGDDAYVRNMATALRSFKKMNAQRPFDYFVLGHAYSKQSRALLDQYEIGYVEVDLHDQFPRRASDQYPSECFWIFKGPDVFHEMGYRYSLSVDGDTWCNRRLDLAWLAETKHLAGVDRGASVAGFLRELGEYQRLERIFRIPASHGRRRATNSGVLFYNNPALASLEFFDRVVDAYKQSVDSGVHRRGDDSTLALVFALNQDVELRVLDATWNVYRRLHRRLNGYGYSSSYRMREWEKDSRIVHLRKPWDTTLRRPDSFEDHFARKWRALWHDTQRKVTPPRTAAHVIAMRKRRKWRRKVSHRTVFAPICYWYRGGKPNLGDEITPYLVHKIAALPPGTALRKRPQDPRKLTEPVLLSLGSVMRLCSSNAIVWGSGIRNIDQSVDRARRFCAVRGPLTRRRLLQLGYECPAVFGDPALLIPRYFRPKVKKRYRLGVIPHVVDHASLSKHYRNRPEVLVINMATTNIESLIRQLVNCEHTVSSALHGLVLSVAYGIPTRWIRCSDKIMGDDTKFYDFFASLNPAVEEQLDTSSVTLPSTAADLEPYRPIRMQKNMIPPQELAAMTNSHSLTVDLDRLIDACPINQAGWKPGIVD